MEKDGLKAEFDCLYPAGDSVRQAVGMAAAEQLRAIGIQVNVRGLSWDEISREMFSQSVLWLGLRQSPTRLLPLPQRRRAAEDYYNPEGYRSEITDGYLQAAMEALTPEEANEYWQLVQWDGETGTAMQGECPGSGSSIWTTSPTSGTASPSAASRFTATATGCR